MAARILKLIGASLLALFILLELSWWIAVPSADKLARVAEGMVSSRTDGKLDISSPSKGFFFNLAADRAILSYKGSYAIPFEKPGLHPAMASLLKGAPGLGFRASLFGGTAIGEIGISGIRKRAPRLSLDVDRVDISKLLEFAGLSGNGLLFLEGSRTGQKGEFRLRVTDLKLEPEGIAALIPVESFRGVNGMLLTHGTTATLKGLEIEGEGMHARMKGQVIGERLDLTLELFLDAETVDENSLILSGIERFKASPGHYRFPVRGTLSNPVIH